LNAWHGFAQGLNDSVAGSFDAARAELQEQFEVAKRLGDDLLQGLALIFLGIVELAAGDGERALRYTEDALYLYRQKGDRVGVALAWSNIAPCYLLLNRIEDVRRAAREALTYARDTYNSRLIIIAIEYLAAAEVQDPKRAARLLGYANAWYASSGTPRDLSEQQAQQRTMERLRNSLAEDILSSALEEGNRFTDADAIVQALLHETEDSLLRS
jgi:tetratricopeptide (TPR) repeat protein